MEGLVIDTTEATGRPGLDRARIVATALTVIDSAGVSALTMRRLGGLMGVEAMSLYRYVVGREALLDAVVEAVMAELDDDPEVRTRPEDGWEDFVTRLAYGVRRLALAHPHAFALVACRPTEAPFVRPPLRTLAWVEAFLGGLTGEGFAPERAVAAYHAFTGTLLGHLLLEVRSADDVTGRPDDRPAHHPTIARLGTMLAGVDAEEEFAATVAGLLKRLGGLRAGCGRRLG